MNCINSFYYKLFPKKMKGIIHIYGENTSLNYKDNGGFQSRNESTIKIFKEMFEKYTEVFKGEILDLYIWTGDKAEEAYERSKIIGCDYIFSYATKIDLHHRVIPIPDFIYDSWSEVGISSYNEMILRCKRSGDNRILDGRCFWAGACNTHPLREKLMEISKEVPEYLLLRDISWKRSKKGEFQKPPRYTSIPEHSQYGSLIDIPGRGYSGRLKLLFHLQRPIFIIDRPDIEFFYCYMTPFKDYIPVKEDLSDFIMKLNWLKENPYEYSKIVKNGKLFAEKYLSKEFALQYLCDVVRKYGCKKI